MTSVAAARQRPPRRRGPDAAGTAPRGPAGRGPAGPAGRTPAAQRRGAGAADAADLDRLAAGFSQAFLEVEAGRRPRAQLERVLCPRLAARLADVWVRPGAAGALVRLHGTLVEADRYEAVAIVRRGTRFGALALTFVRCGQAWRVLDALRPEDGPLPEPTGWFPEPVAVTGERAGVAAADGDREAGPGGLVGLG